VLIELLPEPEIRAGKSARRVEISLEKCNLKFYQRRGSRPAARRRVALPRSIRWRAAALAKPAAMCFDPRPALAPPPQWKPSIC
jgi:hypothetical protein